MDAEVVALRLDQLLVVLSTLIAIKVWTIG